MARPRLRPNGSAPAEEWLRLASGTIYCAAPSPAQRVHNDTLGQLIESVVVCRCCAGLCAGPTTGYVRALELGTPSAGGWLAWPSHVATWAILPASP